MDEARVTRYAFGDRLPQPVATVRVRPVLGAPFPAYAFGDRLPQPVVTVRVRRG
ncbi:hypothetical protein OG342_29155 [Streptomyces bobili]|uniref:hypothetical protein n=1 Tax=Streptomyces bobili TaxID=67280 RepID=UPI002256D149|nr:hypothetical protein [Streptomyces bobili]MCX5526884.1 hypothetical protein [Streptomyces bobili]